MIYTVRVESGLLLNEYLDTDNTDKKIGSQKKKITVGHTSAENVHERSRKYTSPKKMPRNFVHSKAKFFDHHEAGKNHENLTPCASHELQRIIQPIAAAQDQPFDLRMRAFVLRIGQ